MHIDILHAEDCLQRIRWTRRQHDLEQSIRILCGRDQQQLILHIFGRLDQLNSPYTLHDLQ